MKSGVGLGVTAGVAVVDSSTTTFVDCGVSVSFGCLFLPWAVGPCLVVYSRGHIVHLNGFEGLEHPESFCSEVRKILFKYINTQYERAKESHISPLYDVNPFDPTIAFLHVGG